jgi:hypothetical protein
MALAGSMIRGWSTSSIRLRTSAGDLVIVG